MAQHQRTAAASLIPLPTRILATGRSGMGKTTECIRLIAHDLAPSIDRLITICPTYWIQKGFRQLDFLLRSKNDVITKPTGRTMKSILDNVLNINEKRAKQSKPPLHTFLLVDDLSGTKFIQDHRVGDFSNMAIQTPHLNLSCLIITHQATHVSPSYRDNTNVVMSFASQRTAEMKWLVNEYKNPSMSPKCMQEIILNAWRGGRDDDEEWGQHFLVITAPSRTQLRYFGDWERELFGKTEMDMSTKKRKRKREPTKDKRLSKKHKKQEQNITTHPGP